MKILNGPILFRGEVFVSATPGCQIKGGRGEKKEGDSSTVLYPYEEISFQLGIVADQIIFGCWSVVGEAK